MPGDRRRSPTSGDFDDFKGDIEAAERRVAREIDPGARALVIAICVFVLLLTFVLPHTGGAKGWDVLVGDDAAISNGIALPSRVFTWLALVFGVGFSMLALLTRRWALAWIALAGSTVASFTRAAGGVVAADRARTASGPRHRADPRVARGDRAGLQLGPGGVGPHRAAARRRGGTPPAWRPNAQTARACWTAFGDDNADDTATTGRAGEALALLAQRLGGRVGPLTPLLGVGPRLLGVLGPARGRGLLGLAFELLCAGTELVGAGLRLRIDPSGRRVAHLLLHRAQPPLQVGAALARHLADRVPLVADRAQRGPRGVQIGGVEPLRLGQQRLLGVGVGAELGVAFGAGRVAGGEERVLGAP